MQMTSNHTIVINNNSCTADAIWTATKIRNEKRILLFFLAMLIAQLHKCGAGTHFLLLSDQFPEHFYLPPNTSFLFPPETLSPCSHPCSSWCVSTEVLVALPHRWVVLWFSFSPSAHSPKYQVVFPTMLAFFFLTVLFIYFIFVFF